MKKSLLFGFALLFCICAAAQEFTVKSFEAKVTDLTAKVDPVKDLNGEPCALIRVQIACKGCSFLGNIVGKPQERPGEYLVYVPAGTRRLKIAHPDFLPLTYEFNLKIEKNCTYELRVTLPQNQSPVPELNSQFLVLSVAPKQAVVFVNDVLQATADGILSKELPFGEHTYRVEAPMYHPRRGTFTVSQSGKTELSVTLAPAFGFLSVGSSPETGARVFVDGREVGTTPYRSERMASGSYQVQVLKEGYYPQMQPVEITDDRTTTLDLALKASFSNITLQAADPAAEIWVSGKKYGTGSWSGRLEAGTYSVESRREGYENALQSITVGAAQPQTIRLRAQVPVYGILKVASSPVGAAVTLDGKPLGETPLITNKVLVGSHRLEISRTGMVPVTRDVVIDKAKPTEVTVQLSSVYGTVSVLSTPGGAVVRIDGREAGRTPFTSGNLSEGDHVVEVSMAGYAPGKQTVAIEKNRQAKLSFVMEKDDVAYNKAAAAFRSGKNQSGLTLLTQAAEAGNVRAQYELGERYYNGEGVKQNYTLGHYWWWMAAQNGHQTAKKYICNAPRRIRYPGDKGYIYYAWPNEKSNISHALYQGDSGEFSEGLAYVHPTSIYDSPFYRDTRGGRIITDVFGGLPFKNGRAFARLVKSEGGSRKLAHWALIDRLGRTVRSFEKEGYDKIEPFADSLWLVTKTGTPACSGLISATGDVVVAVRYEKIAPFAAGVLLVVENGKTGLVDCDGNTLIPTQYDKITPFGDDKYRVEKDGLSGLTTDGGEVVVPLEYASVIPSKYDGAILKVDQKLYGTRTGLITATGMIVVPCRYRQTPEWKGVFAAEKKGVEVCNEKYQWGLCDLAGNEILPCKYKLQSMTDELRIKAMAGYARKFPEKYAAHLAAAKLLREAGIKE